MGFGYEILRGRQGAAGHCREEAGKKIVCVQGLKPGESCVLYAMREEGPVKQDEQRTNAAGQATLTGRGDIPFFVISGGKVLLWQGGEETYLRASEWAKQQKERSKTEKAAVIVPREANHILKRDLEEIQLAPAERERAPGQNTEETLPPSVFLPALEPDAKEPAYILRPAGSGEPVDALPE